MNPAAILFRKLTLLIGLALGAWLLWKLPITPTWWFVGAGEVFIAVVAVQFFRNAHKSACPAQALVSER